MLSFVANLMIFIVFDLFTDRSSNIGTLTSVFNISSVSRHILEKTLKINKDRRCTFKKNTVEYVQVGFHNGHFNKGRNVFVRIPWRVFPSLPLRYSLLRGFQLNHILRWYGAEKCWHQNFNKHSVESVRIKLLITVWQVWHILERKVSE